MQRSETAYGVNRIVPFILCLLALTLPAGVVLPLAEKQVVEVHGERITLHVRDGEIREVLAEIARQAKMEIIHDMGITGRISISLTDVTVEDALKKLSQSRAFVYEYLPEKKAYRLIGAATFAETKEKRKGRQAGSKKTVGQRKPASPAGPEGPVITPPGEKTCSAAGADGLPSRPQYKSGELLVKFKPGLTAEQISALHLSLGSMVIGRIEGLRLEQVKLREGLTEGEAIELYNASGLVEYAERHVLRYPRMAVNDPEFPKQWGLNKTNVPRSWNFTRGQREVIVAVIDTGVDYRHPDLKDNIWINSAEAKGLSDIDDDGNGYTDDIMGWDFAGRDVNNPQDGDGDPMDLHGHGTHIAGIIAAQGNNGLGIAGINWKISIMPLKVQADNGSYFEGLSVIKAIEYAMAHKARIVVCSFGGKSFSESERQAFAALKNAGILAVCAAGNDGVDADASPTYPAGYALDNIISVAASDENDALAAASNYGLRSVHLMAPGVGIYSTLPVGLRTEASVRVEGQPTTTYPAIGMLYASLTGENGITARMYNCGKGYPEEFPPAVAGNIALIERGSRDGNNFYFADKVTHAQKAGAVGVIIYNNTVDDFDTNGGTLGRPGDWVPVVSLSRAAGMYLLGLGSPLLTLINKPGNHPYGYKSGTSMAVPHVAGAAGLIWAACPNLGYAAVKAAIINSVDKIPAVADKLVSGGRLNALAALQSNFMPGDISGNLQIGLDDAVGALQLMAGIAPTASYPCLPCHKDVNGDGRIDLTEVIFILQRLADLR